MGPYPSINQLLLLFLLFYAIYIMVMTFVNLINQVSFYIHYMIQNYGQKHLKNDSMKHGFKKSFEFL